MKKLLQFFICTLILPAYLHAGDTLQVRAQDKMHLSGYGNFDAWTVFPDSTHTYERIWLDLTYGCPTSGCSQWDYTTKVYYRQHTGTLDSILRQAPQFTVNGNRLDSVKFSTDTTWVYFYNTTTQTTDSSVSNGISLVLFQDSINPFLPTDTLSVFPVSYYNYLYTSTGVIYDSIWVAPDSTWYLQTWPYWDVFEVVNNIEITRGITPYGGLFPNTWSFTWRVDVTDFMPLFRDSAEFRVLYEGYQDGFTITLDFLMIEGTPARKPIGVQPLWTGGYSFGITTDPIESHLIPITVAIPSGATGGTRFHLLQTGHGFGGSDNCAEFCSKPHYLMIDGTQRFTSQVWRDKCGLNPIFPQGGTWIYDRANWCPGERVHPFLYELTPYVTPGNTHILDLDLPPYTNMGNNFPGYGFGASVIHYAPPAFTRDAGVEEVLSPSAFARHGRYNPSCGGASVVVRNSGTDVLQSLTVTYGVVGNPVTSTYTWTGQKNFLDTLLLTLPVFDWSDSQGTRQFFIRITDVNNSGQDQYAQNDTFYSSYNAPPVYNGGIVVRFKANTQPAESSYRVEDELGNIVHSSAGFMSNLITIDTIRLSPGCYRFIVEDTDGDGLDFFANNDGAGYVRLFAVNTTLLLKNFTPDFGTSLVHYFTVDYALGQSSAEIAENLSVEIYPNPADTEVMIDFPDGKIQSFEYSLLDVWGSTVLTGKSESSFKQISTQSLTAGVYLMIIQTATDKVIRRVIIQ